MQAETETEKQTRWDKEWKNATGIAALGNPFATLCRNCYGRHKPPRDEECQHPTLTTT